MRTSSKNNTQQPSSRNGIALVLSAAEFAANRHGTQTRKDAKGTPYILHPLRVADTLATVGRVGDPEILAAALLHDVIEDTGTHGYEIESRFGSRVRTLVEEVSDDKSLPKAERKRLQIAHAPHTSRDATLIKLGDKIDNVTDLISHLPTGWTDGRRREYIRWATEVVDRLPKLNEHLFRWFHDVTDNYEDAAIFLKGLNDGVAAEQEQRERESAHQTEHAIPEGIIKCEHCGEYNGKTMAKFLNWEDSYNRAEMERSERIITVRCLCHGILCRKSKKNKIHRPISNTYVPESNTIEHAPYFSGMMPCSECRSRTSTETNG